MTKLTLQINVDQQWHDAAVFTTSDDAGSFTSPATIEYAGQYLVANFARTDEAALSACYPVDSYTPSTSTWPAFMLDILPLGYGARRLEDSFRRTHGRAPTHLELLGSGSGNSIGNLRVKEAWVSLNNRVNPFPDGFELAEVLERGDTFMAYAIENGLSAQATSGAQGEAPKILLTEDENGRWHADGLLPDGRARRHVLAKYPRGNTEADLLILRNEAAYMRVAAAMGLRANENLLYENNTLVIPRFDRAVGASGVIRYAQETLMSLAERPTIGENVPHTDFVAALALYANDPAKEIGEYLCRDILNVVMLNRDNHGRNTSVRRYKGLIELTPLYDFAPMAFDPAVIVRSSIWPGLEASAGRRFPDYGKVLDLIAEPCRLNTSDVASIRERVLGFAERLAMLPNLMREAGVGDSVIGRIGDLPLRVASELGHMRHV